MYDLYTWPTPNGRKVSIALEELAVPYEAHAVDILKGDQFRPEFVAISPNSKIPALVDRVADRSLFESGAILVYLAERHDQLRGTHWWQTLQWLMFQMGGLGPVLGQVHHFKRFNPGVSPYAEKRFADEAERLYAVLEAALATQPYLAGEYSIADIACWPWISRYEWQQIDLECFPSLCRWYVEIAARPAVQRGYDVPTAVNPIPLPGDG